MSTPYYADEHITLYHGDCREVLESMADQSVDCVITDPPYNVTEFNGRDGTTVGKVKRKDGTYREVTRNFGDWDRDFRPAYLTGEAKRLLRHRGGLVAFTADRILGEYINDDLHHMRTLVWRKTNPAPQFPGNYQSACEWIVWQGNGGPPTFNGGGSVPNVYDAPIPSGKDHPNQKPLAILMALVERHTNPGELVLDPYAGSGTTLRAAADLGRRVIGVEQDERYCELIATRLAQGALDFGEVSA